MGITSFRERLISGWENSATLETAAERINKVLKPILDRPAPMDMLSGRIIGHPLHPVAVQVPIGCWTAALILDLARPRGRELNALRHVSHRADPAALLIGVGLAAVAPAVLTGSVEWLHTRGAERRIGLVHAGANVIASGLYGASLALRWQRKAPAAARGLAALAYGVLGVGGWLGGHLAYVRGVGVNTTAFLSGPTEWTDTIHVSEIPEGGLGHAIVNGVHVALCRAPDGIAVTAMEARCSHRGGPLHEGKMEDNCIQCPWHGARFDASSGEVRKGPASANQTCYAVRLAEDGIIQVKSLDAGGFRASVT